MTFDPWDENNPVILPFKDGSENANVEIVLDEKADNNICGVFFSSHGLYFPNTEEEFRKKIEQQNRYDYRNVARDVHFKKKIFLRDLHKQWYVTGINNKLNTVEKVAAFLKRETAGYHCILVGSSAGGYAATLFGCLIGGTVLNYSGQFDLTTFKQGVAGNPLLNKYQHDEDRAKYYSLHELIAEHPETAIYYFCPINAADDISQKEASADLPNVYRIQFKYAEHSRTHSHAVLPYVINGAMKLDGFYQKYSNKVFDDISFSRCFLGVWKTVRIHTAHYIAKITGKH